MRELYVVALYATRPARAPAGADDHEVALRVALGVAAGLEEARGRAAERLLELCPPAEGWVNHHVAAGAVGAEQLRAVLESLPEDPSGGGADDAAGWPELIM